MSGLLRHRGALESYGGANFLKAIAGERLDLCTKYNSDPAFAYKIDSMKDAPLVKAWTNLAAVYPSLVTFCTGLAIVLPSTHTVESDFSVLKATKDNPCRSMSNYAMEGQMQAKQYKDVKNAVGSSPGSNSQ
ncbi:hypothetical protein ACHHYP_20344 [Achlya hypogyna]|uniref:Uncharacterized protein n=1 Tax=Achlya hypogyna TaxID=1202772 RepID=A0A1V9ZLF5_ACHHY|nr:hypothetical protein ACHHYP_20344 [Achlya hypogyna]